MKAIIIAPDEIPVRAGFFTDFEDRLVSGELTADGIQWSTEVTSGGADVLTDALAKLIDPVLEGRIILVEFGLTAWYRQIGAPGAATDLRWQWQARNKNGTWVDLHPEVTEAASEADTNYERTRSGFAAISANFNAVPFELRLQFRTSLANQPGFQNSRHFIYPGHGYCTSIGKNHNTVFLY